MGQLPEKYAECGVRYWSFLQGKRCNPWSIKPTAKMIESGEIQTIVVKEYVPSGIKGVLGQTMPGESYEVFFDADYVRAYKEKCVPFFNVLLLLEDEVKPDLTDKFDDFEKENGLTLSSKNPRHSLYLKYKEYQNHENCN